MNTSENKLLVVLSSSTDWEEMIKDSKVEKLVWQVQVCAILHAVPCYALFFLINFYAFIFYLIL